MKPEISTHKLLVAFFKDVHITERKDLDGNDIGGYEFFSSCSVGGFLHREATEYLMEVFGRNRLERTALDIRIFNAEYDYDCSGVYDKILGTKEIQHIKDKNIEKVSDELMKGIR